MHRPSSDLTCRRVSRPLSASLTRRRQHCPAGASEASGAGECLTRCPAHKSSSEFAATIALAAGGRWLSRRDLHFPRADSGSGDNHSPREPLGPTGREHSHLARGTWRVSRHRRAASGHAHLAPRLLSSQGFGHRPLKKGMRDSEWDMVALSYDFAIPWVSGPTWKRSGVRAVAPGGSGGHRPPPQGDGPKAPTGAAGALPGELFCRGGCCP